MSFTIPNEADAAFADQSEPDKVDLDILVAALAGDGVISGCQVTAQGSPDMSVHVAAGTVTIGGATAAVTADDLSVTAADATNPRFDLVAADDTGALAMVDGTADPNPVFPAVPADSVILASVYVPATDTDVDSNQIVDKRAIVRSPYQSIAISDTGGTTAQTSDPIVTDRSPAISLVSDITDAADTFQTLTVCVLTRRAGMPWHLLPAVEHSPSGLLFSYMTNYNIAIAASGNVFPMSYINTWLGLLDEAVVIAQPYDFSTAVLATGTSGDTNIVFCAGAALKGDFANAFTVDLVDPGAADQPLSISSTDGYTMTISLETDGGGDIVTTAGDLQSTIGVNGWQYMIDIQSVVDSGVLVADETIPLTGGAGNSSGLTYTVTGKYA